MVSKNFVEFQGINKKKIIISSLIAFAVIVLLTKNKIKKVANKILSDEDKKKFILSILPASQSIGNKIGVPPMFIVAQICLESNFGASLLSSKYFNYGGIKATGTQRSVNLPTTECKGNQCFKTNANFAVFNDQAEGIAAQSKIYTNKYFKGYLNKTQDPIKYAQLLQSGSVKYATALNYPQAIANTLKKVNSLLT